MFKSNIIEQLKRWKNRPGCKLITLLCSLLLPCETASAQQIVERSETKNLKEIIRRWLVNMDQTEEFPSDIVALSFNLYEPYSIEMIGSTQFDEDDEDWACSEDFVPTQRSCPDFELPNNLKWEDALEIVVEILKDLVDELPDLKIFNIEHIAVGFVDGNLIIIK